MATTQYVGARYVPLIYQNPDDNSNNWKQGVSYDPLTIVSYAGGSYTSKTFVPATAPNPVDATEYWVAIGLYSGQTAINTNAITQIKHALAAATEAGYVCTEARTKGDFVWINGALYECTADIAIDESYTEGVNITPISDSLKVLVNTVDDIRGRLTTAEDTITTLSGDMSDAQIDITNLENAVAPLVGMHDFTTRVLVCVSDSYGFTPNVDDSWIGKLKAFLNIPDNHFYRTQENASGFIGVGTTTFLQQIQTLAGSMTTEQKNAVTDFIIGGGMNDAWALKNGTTATDMSTAIGDCLTYVRANFPKATIYLFVPAWRLDSAYHPYLRGIINLYQQNIRRTTRTCFIDGVNWLHRQALLDTTEYHPNGVGAFCIALSIASKLCGGDAFCDLAPDVMSGYIIPAISASSNVTNANFNTLRQYYSNGLAFMSWRNISFNPVNAVTDGASVDIGTFTDGIMSGGTLFEGYTAPVNWGGNGQKGILVIATNKLIFVNTSGTTIAAGTPVSIVLGSISGPVML